MSGSKKANAEIAETKHNQYSWLAWCRLCARQCGYEKENEIFPKNDTGQATALTTSIGKYFWVNIKVEDELSKCICKQCRILIDELCTFTERVNKVQTLYCLLQNLKPESEEEANKLRSQCGLLKEGWEHIIKEPTVKPISVNQEVQTDLVIFFNNGSDGIHKKSKTEQNSPKHYELENIEEILMAVEHEDESMVECTTPNSKYKLLDVTITRTGNESKKKNSNKKLRSEIELEREAERNFEMMVNDDDSLVEIDENDFRGEIVKCEDVEDSDLFKELKFNGDVGEDVLEKSGKHEPQDENNAMEFESAGEDNVTEDDTEDYVEIEEEEECEDNFEEDSNQVDGENSNNDNALEGLTRKKRGRPLGTKPNKNVASQYRYQCLDCKRKYKNPNVYRKHMLVVHSTTVEEIHDFECPVCQKDCHTKSRLEMHKRQHMTLEEKLVIPCPYCERKFSFVGAMRQHVRGFHQNLKPYICDQCGRACKTLAALNEHQLVHTDKKPFVCKLCDKAFKTNARMKAHMDTHNESEYVCPDCGLKLNTRRTLLQHRLVHTNVKQFKCEFCDSAFKRSKSLKNHLLIHTGLRPYKCQFCDKTFSNGANCRSHKRRVHPTELAEEEALGKKNEPVAVPKLEELKAAKTAVVQPRKIRRHVPAKHSGEDSNESYEVGDIHYEIRGEGESLSENQDEDGCEETVIYEIIDEI
ncbi:uncharacterized protein LOC142223200 [Haematobia irritans]|uniref:uncharacterized protein LOC142223200 n=1 Tax=Haematobia irritans TaxID=7368 RepID=UPI003F4F5554